MKAFNGALFGLVRRHLHITKAWVVVEQFLSSGVFMSEQMDDGDHHTKCRYSPGIRLEPSRVLRVADRLIQSRFSTEYARWKTAIDEALGSVWSSDLEAGAPGEVQLGGIAIQLSERIASGRDVYWKDVLELYESAAGTAKSLERTIDYDLVRKILALTMRRLMENHPDHRERWEKALELVRRSVPLDAKRNIIILKEGAQRWATVKKAPIREQGLFTPLAPARLALRFMKGDKPDADAAALQWANDNASPRAARVLTLLSPMVMLCLPGMALFWVLHWPGWLVVIAAWILLPLTLYAANVATRSAASPRAARALTLLFGLVMLGVPKAAVFWVLQWPGWLLLIATVILLLFTLYAATLAILSALSTLELIQTEVALSAGAIETSQRLLSKMGAHGLFSRSDAIRESMLPTVMFLSAEDVAMLHEDTDYLEIKEYKQIWQRLTRKLLYSGVRRSVDEGILATYLNMCRKLGTVTGNSLYSKLEQKAIRDHQSGDSRRRTVD